MKQFKIFRKTLLLTLILSCIYSITIQLHSSDNVKTAIELGVNKEGLQSSKWIAAITDRHSPGIIQKIKEEKTPLTENE